MSKIRINELARQLEVKSRDVIDKLHELGIAEKVTHSSSIEDEKADQLRRYYAGDHTGLPERPVRKSASAPDVAPEPELHAAPEKSVEPAKTPETAKPVAPPVRRAAPVAEQPSPTPGAAPAQPAEQAKTEEEKREENRPRAVPLRAPLLGRGAPIHPPVGVRASGPPTLPPPVPRPTPPPPRPIPSAAPKPGQVLSGPRQPLPPSALQSSPAARPSGVPGAPIAPPPGARPGTPIAPPPRPVSATPGAPQPRPAAPSQPMHPRPTAGQPMRPVAGQPIGRPLAGQPAARPTVPPRADLAARLGQQPPRTSFPGQAPVVPPAMPGQPRPGVPMRPQTPRPGQPLYQGPARPGQGGPMQARAPYRPGMPGGAARPGGPRPMHPTSRGGPLLPGAPPPPDMSRRPQARRAPARGGSGGKRKRESEEGILRQQVRREIAAPPPISRDITISEGITVKELSEKLDVKTNFVIKKLVDRGIFATINQTLDSKLATEISREFGASTSTVSFEEEAMIDVDLHEESADRFRRPPVVTIMGHVDHGKTSLLDAIRLANVAGKEAGGITQHIGAYHVEKNGQNIVFIDTPGHEAFTRMRARGAKVTDIVILVVAADDGVMPQTLEAIDHARAAKVPIIVAINKIDKENAQVDRIKQQLSDRGLLAEDWGGDTVMVPVSARQKTNLDLLLEMILIVSELADLRANPARPALATVLEAKLDRGRGPVATVLVRNGTLRVGDDFVCGSVFGRVRAMIGDLGEPVKEVGPSMPVEVLGLEKLPDAGDTFQVVTDTAKAKQIVLYRAERDRAANLAKSGRITLEQFHKQMAAGEVKELPIILKADVGGSSEVLRDTLEKLSTDKVTVRVIRSGVGAINESDVLLAAASNAIVIGFNVRPERNAAAAAEQEKVDLRLHTIIYELLDEMKKAMTGLLAPVFKEVYKGKIEVREVFRVSKVGTVAGCFVHDGNIPRDAQVRITRDNVVVHTGKIGSLRRFKDDVSEVRSGMECGVTLDNFNDVKQGDIIEAYGMQRVANEAI